MHSCTALVRHMHAWPMTDVPEPLDVEVTSVKPCVHPWQTQDAFAWLHGEHQTLAGSGDVTQGSGSSRSGVGNSFLCLRYACAHYTLQTGTGSRHVNGPLSGTC